MRVAVVGPTHPYKGGIAQHTTELARRLRDDGHEVVLHSWRNQYPKALYPGVMEVSDEDRDVAEFDAVERRLMWFNPWSWISLGRRLRDADVVVLAHSNPFQLLPHHLIMRGVRSRRRGHATRVLVAHNVVPHDAGRVQRRSVRLLARNIDHVLVHSVEEAERAAALLPNVPATRLPLPPFGPAVDAQRDAAAHARNRSVPDDGVVRLLAVGFIRPYKGLEVLLEAMRDAPQVHVTIRGECWTEEYEAALRSLAGHEELAGRVDLRVGYVPESELADLFRGHDMVALPYLEATGSQNAALAFAYGLPVIASDLGALVEGVADGVDGVVVPPGDVAAWSTALCALTPESVRALTANVRGPDVDGAWKIYVQAILDAHRDNGAAAALERGAHITRDADSRREKARRIVELVGEHRPIAGSLVLDDGCGSGHIAASLAAHVEPSGTVVAIDRADERDARDGHAFVAATGTGLPFRDGSFDLVVSNHVLEHVGEQPEQRAYLAEVRRVLQGGGVLYLAVPNRHRLVEAHYRLPLLSWLPHGVADRAVRLTRRGTWYDIRPLTRREVAAMLADAGFDATDHTERVAREAFTALPVVGAVLGRLPGFVLRAALPVAPTIIVVARPR